MWQICWRLRLHPDSTGSLQCSSRLFGWVREGKKGKRQRREKRGSEGRKQRRQGKESMEREVSERKYMRERG